MNKRTQSDKYFRPDQMRRKHPSYAIDSDLIPIPECENDPIFLDLWTKYLLGQEQIVQTRLSLSKIKPGFLKRASTGEIQYIQDQISEGDLRFLTANILMGSRPCLYIYRSPLSQENDFVCPDDISSYQAYALLGITKVPVQILNYQPTYLEESALHFKKLGPVKTNEDCFIGAEAAAFEKLESLITWEERYHFTEVMNVLCNNVRLVTNKVRNFHLQSEHSLHYHHTLISVLYRLENTLQAIKLLFDQKLLDQAIVQLRAIYELAITFYLDWLAPEIIGPRLQLHAIDSDHLWTKLRKATYQEKRQAGWGNSDIKQLKASDHHLQELIGTVAEKAKINPLHSKHADLYKFLSRFAHQDFVVTARYAHLLENPDDVLLEPNLEEYIAVYTNLISSQIVSRIESDIGDSMGAIKGREIVAGG